MLKVGMYYYREDNNGILQRITQCSYCGDRINHSTQSIDHIIPKSKGGINDTPNKILVCKSCNYDKNDLLPGAYYCKIKKLSLENPENKKYKIMLKTLKHVINYCFLNYYSLVKPSYVTKLINNGNLKNHKQSFL